MNLRTSTRPNTSTTRDTRSSGPSSPEKVGATATCMTWCSNLKQPTSIPTARRPFVSSHRSEARGEAKSVGQTAWLGGTSLLRLSRLGKCPDLPKQAKLVLHVPRLGDLASLYAVEGDAREFHLPAGRSNAHIVPLMGGSAPPACHHILSLGYEVLDGAYHVREALPEICCLLLGSLGLISCKEFLCCVEVTCMVPEFCLLPAYHGLVLFRRHLHLLLPGPLSPGGQRHRAWCHSKMSGASRRYTLIARPAGRRIAPTAFRWALASWDNAGGEIPSGYSRSGGC